jgi:hypothetical protein
MKRDDPLSGKETGPGIQKAHTDGQQSNVYAYPALKATLYGKKSADFARIITCSEFEARRRYRSWGRRWR